MVNITVVGSRCIRYVFVNSTSAVLYFLNKPRDKFLEQARSRGGGGSEESYDPLLTADGPHFGHPIDRINVVIGPIPFLALKITFNLWEHLYCLMVC